MSIIDPPPVPAAVTGHGGFTPAWLEAATSETLRVTLAHCAGVHARRHGEAETCRVLRIIADRLERKPAAAAGEGRR